MSNDRDRRLNVNLHIWQGDGDSLICALAPDLDTALAVIKAEHGYKR